MTEIKTTKIPQRQKCVNKEHPYIGGAVDIFDDKLEKPQVQVNEEILNEIGDDDTPDSIKGRVKTLEDEVGTDETEGTLKGRIKTIEDEIGDDTTEESLSGRIKDLEEAVGDGGSVDERIAEEGAKHYLKTETYNKTELNSMITTPDQEYVTVTATDQTTDVTDVLPATGSADTVYRVGNWDGTQFDETVYSEYAWNGSAYVHLGTKTQIGEVFDISTYHATGGELAKYADLTAALDSNNGGGVPQSLQKGGMSVKFVCSYDNKYVQYRLMSSTFNTTPANWQKFDSCKLIKLAKWGGAGNPTDLNVGDIYTTNGQHIYRVDDITGGVVTAYTELPFEDGAVYILYNELYVYNGSILVKDSKVVLLTGIGTKATSGITEAGQFYYNTGTNIIYRCSQFNTNPDDSSFVEMPSLVNKNCLYLCNGIVYYFNGTTLVSLFTTIFGTTTPFGDKIAAGSDEIPRNVAFDENYGLRQGYLYLDYFHNNTKRVCTKLINALVKDVKIKVSSNDFIIKGYISLDANYSTIEYVSNLLDRQNVTLPKGYYYCVIFSRSDDNLNITPDEISPYIWIDDRIIVNELNKLLANTDLDVNLLAETNTWYTGTDVGSEIVKTTYNYCYAIKIDVLSGETYRFSVKGGGNGRGWYFLDSTDKIVAFASNDFIGTVTKTIPEGVSYLIIQSNSGSSYLSLTKLGNIDILKTRVEIIENDVQEIEANIQGYDSEIESLKRTQDSFKCLTPFLWNKLSRLKTLDSGFCNIGFIGDSWTQGTPNSIDGVSQNDYQGYVRPLTKMLQDEYGFGGLGWLDFARDHGTGKMFGCAEMYEHWTYEFTGTITGLDGSDNTQAKNCLGICCAHTIFANAATLTLTFNAGYLDKFKIRYYKNAHFTVSINGGTATEVTANSTDRWQETEFGITGTDTTSVVITSLADNTIIFGMDCFYGTNGVRCHKIGNRSIQAADYLLMDATQWEEGITLLSLSWASVLLAINDLGSSTSESKMNTIVNNISSLIDRIKVATDDGNGLVTCDLNLLGVDNIEASGYVGLGALAKKQKAMALQSGYGWCSTDKCIGSKKNEFVYTGTFSDTIHLNSIGSYTYAKHIYNSLFKF